MRSSRTLQYTKNLKNLSQSGGGQVLPTTPRWHLIPSSRLAGAAGKRPNVDGSSPILVAGARVLDELPSSNHDLKHIAIARILKQHHSLATTIPASPSPASPISEPELLREIHANALRNEDTVQESRQLDDQFSLPCTPPIIDGDHTPVIPCRDTPTIISPPLQVYPPIPRSGTSTPDLLPTEDMYTIYNGEYVAPLPPPSHTHPPLPHQLHTHPL
jgi:hypothetical protein